MGGEARMCKEINSKWGLPYSPSWACLPFSWLLLSEREVSSGETMQVPPVAHLHPKCSCCVPCLAGLGWSLSSLLKFLMNLWGRATVFISSWTFFLIFLSCFLQFCFCFSVSWLSKGKATGNWAEISNSIYSPFHCPKLIFVHHQQ